MDIPIMSFFFGNREVKMFTASQKRSFVNRKLGHQPFRQCVLHVTPCYPTKGPRICGKSFTTVGFGSSTLQENWQNMAKLCCWYSKQEIVCRCLQMFAAFLGIHTTLFCSPMSVSSCLHFNLTSFGVQGSLGTSLFLQPCQRLRYVRRPTGRTSLEHFMPLPLLEVSI